MEHLFFEQWTRGGADIACSESEIQRREHAYPSYLQRQKDWCRDRRAQRSLAPTRLTSSEPSEITCELCGCFIGLDQSEMYLTFYPIYGRQVIKMETEQRLVHNQILYACGTCVRPRKNRPKRSHIALFGPKDWLFFQEQGRSQAEIKRGLTWLRFLFECILFGGRWFLSWLTAWLQRRQQPQPEPSEELCLGATLTFEHAPTPPVQFYHMPALASEGSHSLARFHLHQQWYRQLSHDQ